MRVVKTCLWGVSSVLMLSSAVSAAPLAPRPPAPRPVVLTVEVLSRTARSLTAGGLPDRRKKKCLARLGRRCKQWGRVLVPAKITPSHAAVLKKLDALLTMRLAGRVLALVLLNKGLIYLYYGHENKALGLLVRVATKLQGTAPAAARQAAVQALRILEAMKQKTRLHALLKRLRADKQLMADKRFAGRMDAFEVSRQWYRGDALRKQAKYSKCGDLFLRLWRQFSSHPRVSALLFNAGSCYEAAGELRKAIQARLLLFRRYPQGRFAPYAMYYLAQSYHKMFFPKLAARWYERFARKYPKRKESHTSFMRAITLRSGLLQKRHVRRLVGLFLPLKRYPRARQDVARAAWLLVKLELDWGSRYTYHRELLRYLKTVARLGGVARHIEALVRVGQLAWERSCKVRMTDGLCVRIRYYRTRGSAKKSKRVIYLSRSARQVAIANRYFTQALRVWANGRGLLKIPKHAADRAARLGRARRYAAQAMFMRAELGLEKTLRRRVPTGLDFDPIRPAVRQRSEERLRKWLSERTSAARRLARAYLQTVTKVQVGVGPKRHGDAHWSLAAVSRAALLYQAFGEALLDAPVPGMVRGSGARDAFRAVIRRYSKPLLKQATARYRLCAKLTHKLRWYNEWSTRCYRALHRLEPSKYRRGRERYGLPGYFSTRITPAGFQ